MSELDTWTAYSVSHLSGSGKMHSVQVKTGQVKEVPTPESKCESESDPLDIACHDAVMMMLDVISELDMHFQLGSAIMSRRRFIQLKHLQ